MQDLLDALGYVGSSLDKLGPRPLRGLLAGHPRELASIVPFSDKLGLTDPTEVQRGRDVTNNLGLTRKNDTGVGSHAAGLLAEAILDPAGAYGAYKGVRAAHSGLMGAARASVGQRGSRLGFNDFLVGGFPKDKPTQNAIDYAGPAYNFVTGEHLFQDQYQRFRGGMTSLRRGFESMSPQEQRRLYQEIPPGSEAMSPGAEGLVFKTPHKTVIKVAPAMNLWGHATPEEAFRGVHQWPTPGRPKIPHTLRPIRSNVFGDPQAGIRVEHMHQVEPLDSVRDLFHEARMVRPFAPGRERDRAQQIMDEITRLNDGLAGWVKKDISTKYPELDPFDVRSGNVSRVGAKNLVVHDDGAIAPYSEEEFRRQLQGPPTFPSATKPDAAMLAHVMASITRDSPEDALQEALLKAAANPKKLASLGVPAPPSHGMFNFPLEARDHFLEELKDFVAKYQHALAGHATAPRQPTPTTSRRATMNTSELRQIVGKPADSAAWFNVGGKNQHSDLLRALGGT